MKIAIIYNSQESGVINNFGIQNKEFYTKKTVSRVAQFLESAGHNVIILEGDKFIINRLENFMPRVIEGESMGMVFNMAYGIQGESRYTHIPSMLEMLGIPYVGSSPSGHTLALDKVLTKIIWKNHGLPTPDFWVYNSINDDFSGVRYPVIVKPKMESVSFGLRVVDNEKDLKEAVDFIINEFNQQALVEQFISGREFCVGLLGNSPIEAFPVLEIDLEGDPEAIQTVEDKKVKPRNKICPADISDELSAEMKKISIEAFKALNLRDFARVDIRLDLHGNIHLLEINSMASLGKTGSYLHSAEVAGYDYQSLIIKMLDVAAVRYFSENISPDSQDIEKSKLPLQSRLRTFLRSRQPMTEKILKKLVNINTQSRNVDSVNKCVQIIQGEMANLGFTHETFPQLEVGNLVFFTNTFENNLDFLILLTLDNKVKVVNHKNYTEDDQYITGTGVWENKGGIAVCISALQALRFSKKLKKRKIGILLLTDNQLNGKFSNTILKEKSGKAKFVIGMHGATTNGGIITSRSGSASYIFTMRMIDTAKAEKFSAIASFFNRTIAKICDLSQDDESMVIAPYDIVYQSNIFKQTAFGSAGISVRFNDLARFEAIDEKLRKITQPGKLLKNIIEVSFDGGMNRPPIEKNDINDKFYQDVVKIAKKIDVRITSEHRWSSSDICHISESIPKLDGMGPLGEYKVNDNEKILRYSLLDKSLFLASIIESLHF